VKAVQERLSIQAGAVSLSADITVPESSPGVVLSPTVAAAAGSARAIAPSPSSCTPRDSAPSWSTCSQRARHLETR